MATDLGQDSHARLVGSRAGSPYPCFRVRPSMPRLTKALNWAGGGGVLEVYTLVLP